MRAHMLDAEGVILSTIIVDSLDFMPNLVDAEIGGTVGDRVVDGALMPAQPDLAPLKAAKNAEINQWRLSANLSTFPHEGKLIACDTLSRSDIDGVANCIALTGAFPVNFPGGWKTVDNSILPMPTIDDFKAMYASMTVRGTANFQHAQDMKTLLAAAKTAEDIAAIVW